MDTFTRAYIRAALWATMGDDGEPLDRYFSPADLASEAFVKVQTDCKDFVQGMAQTTHDTITEMGEWERAGRDFFLTRNGHGAGFWDGDWPNDLGERLTALSKSFGESEPYEGSDARIHFS